MFKAPYCAAFLAFAQPALAAGVCDYTPSEFIGSYGTGAVSGAAATTAAAGKGFPALGYYSFKHFVTGAKMIGSTAPGASGAGTVGIIAHTGGAVGSFFALLVSTPVVVGGAVIATGIVAFEGGCYFFDGS